MLNQQVNIGQEQKQTPKFAEVTVAPITIGMLINQLNSTATGEPADETTLPAMKDGNKWSTIQSTH